MSQQVSVRVPDELNARIEAYADEHDYTKSEAVRTLLGQGLETDELRSENRRLREQLAATNRWINETTEIVEYVCEERELQRNHRDFDRDAASLVPCATDRLSRPAECCTRQARSRLIVFIN